MKEWLIRMFGTVGKFLSVLFKTAIKKELEVALPIAQQVVLEIAKDPTLVTSGAKRDAAVASMLTQLATQQVTVGLSIINLAIELAVQNQKNP